MQASLTTIDDEFNDGTTDLSQELMGGCVDL